MPQTRPNKTTVPVNADGYNLTADLAAMADSANVTIPVATQAERDALTKFTGMVVARMDFGGTREIWDGAAWQRGDGSTTPTAGAGWTLTGSLVKTRGTAGTQISAAFKAIYSGGTFTVSNTSWIQAFTLTNTGYLPVTNDGYGYFMLRAAGTRNIKADCAFTIDSTGAVYVRTLLGQASTTCASGDELSFNTVWNA